MAEVARNSQLTTSWLVVPWGECYDARLMSHSLKPSVTAIVIALVGLSGTSWEMAHATTHEQEAEHHGDTRDGGSDGVVNEGLPPGHEHAELGRAVAGRGTVLLETTVAPMVSRGFLPLISSPIRRVLLPATMPRAGPSRAFTSLPRAPPIA